MGSYYETAFSCIIFLKILTIVSNFKFIPYFNFDFAKHHKSTFRKILTYTVKKKKNNLQN